MKIVDSVKYAGYSIPDTVLPELWEMCYYDGEDVLCDDLNGVTIIMIAPKKEETK